MQRFKGVASGKQSCIPRTLCNEMAFRGQSTKYKCLKNSHYTVYVHLVDNDVISMFDNVVWNILELSCMYLGHCDHVLI